MTVLERLKAAMENSRGWGCEVSSDDLAKLIAVAEAAKGVSLHWFTGPEKKLYDALTALEDK